LGGANTRLSGEVPVRAREFSACLRGNADHIMFADDVRHGKKLAGCMARVPDRKTILKALSIALVLAIAAGGVFFVLAPYQASRIRAALANQLYARGETPLVLATAAEDGAYYALGSYLQLHLNAANSYTLDVQSTPGSVANLQMLESGEADLAFIQGGLAAERSNMSGDWGGLVPEPEKLVALANLGRQYVHVVVPADSEIREFRDLAGKRLGVGASNSGFEALAGRVMTFFQFREPTELVHDHNPDLANAFLDGEIDAAFTVYGLFAPAMEKLLDLGWYRLVPIVEADAVSRYIPGTFSETLPPYLYGPDRNIPTFEDGPFNTLAVNTLLVCQSDLPDRQVYTILEEVFSGPFLKRARLTDLDESDAQTALHLPLHAAAEAFYNRRNPISSDRFEILSFFLAGVVCIASVVHFLHGRRRISIQSHRRNAIRPYFEAMMDFGDSVESANNPSNLTCLIHKIMATQRGAERKWLEGEFDTEDMENLYAVYSLRCNNAFNKIFDLHLQAMRGVSVVEPVADTGLPEESWRGDDTDGGDDDWQRSLALGTHTTVSEREELYRPPAPDTGIHSDTADDDFFTGAPLAGIDKTKKEVAESLPSRYDSGLLYDTEASGAGAVRVRTPRPAAELQATVNRDVPEVGENVGYGEADTPEDDGHDQMMLF
jgi:uncharacterized protein